MNLHSNLISHPGVLAQHRMLRHLLCIAFLLACAAPFHEAHASGVYVSGKGVALDQAFKQALADNPRKSKEAFWIVVAGTEVIGLTKSGANADILGWLKSARERGGNVFVCRSDMTRGGIKEEDLLDGVVSMYGYGEKDWSGLLPAKRQEIVLPDSMKQSQLILKTCAGEPKPGA
jgi:intracellular sulfur oxidation DsrE/DsrF family protein